MILSSTLLKDPQKRVTLLEENLRPRCSAMRFRVGAPFKERREHDVLGGG